MSAFLDALREEVDSEVALGSAAVLGALILFTDVTWLILVAAGIVFGATTAINVSRALPGVNSRALSAVLFAFGTLCGLYVTLVESSSLMGGITLFAAWLTLDALYDTVNGIEPTQPKPSEFDEMSAGEAGRMTYRAGKVQQALDESPASLSASELVTRTGLSEAQVREALSFLEDADAVLEERERYELVEQPGLFRSTVRRFARPFSLFTPSR